jgi:uncharacterized protein YndB with AHSA1/START domain
MSNPLFARPVTFCATGRVPGLIDTVFAVLTNPARMPEWLPGCGGAASDDPIGQGVHIGARFRSRVTEFVVVDYAPPHRFGWAERGQRRGWRLWFRLNAADGETALTICEVWAPTSFGAWVWGHVIRRRHPERDVQQILERLRHILR